MTRKIILATTVFFLAVGATAQRKWSLAECVDYAIEHNLDIRQQALTVENAELDLNTAQNSRLPNLNASASQNLNFGRSQNQATGIYEANQTTSTNIGASSSIPIFQGLRINRQIEANELNLSASMEGLKRAEENLGLQVATYYLDALFKKELLKVAREQVSLTGLQVERTNVLVEEGKVPRSQQYEIEAQLARNELTLTTAQNDLAASLLNLSQLLNLADPGAFDVLEPDLDDSAVIAGLGSLISPEEIYRQALAVKPHVREAEYRLESSEKSVKIAESARYPSVSLGLSYSSGYSYVFNRDGTMPIDPFFDQLRGNQRQSIGLSMSIPIFNRMATRNQIRAAQLNRESRALELENVKLALDKEIRQAWQSAVAAESRHSATTKAYQATTTALDYARERYDIGKMTVYEFSEAQMQMISSRSEQLQAKYDFLFRTKILDFYRGEAIEIF
jgi:outer membrane protein